MTVKDNFTQFIRQLQDTICQTIEKMDGKEKFVEDIWQRPEGGGGISRSIVNGNVFEKGGVNTSTVFGDLPVAMMQNLNVEHAQFFACGISLVLHPLNPMVPTVHANFRYFELYDGDNKLVDNWFGGGADLTPFYLFEEDAQHFHQTFKDVCDMFGEGLYEEFKNTCDTYFVNRHRDNESRGIGGIFYDYLRSDAAFNRIELTKHLAESFLAAYVPIVERRKNLTFTEQQRDWQLYRRGRYVEFNLIHDRGTLFGLKTNGRIESILMSLPPLARWEYNFTPTVGSPEYELTHILKNPIKWAN